MPRPFLGAPGDAPRPPSSPSPTERGSGDALAAAAAALAAVPPAAVGARAWASSHAALETLAAAATSGRDAEVAAAVGEAGAGAAAALLVGAGAWRERAVPLLPPLTPLPLPLYAALRTEGVAATLLAAVAGVGTLPPPDAAAAAARWAARRAAWFASPAGRAAAAGLDASEAYKTDLDRWLAETAVGAGLAALPLLRALAAAAPTVPPPLEAALRATDPLPALADLLSNPPWLSPGRILAAGGWAPAPAALAALPPPSAAAWGAVACLALGPLGASRDWAAPGAARLASSLLAPLAAPAVAASLGPLPPALAPLLADAAAGRVPPPPPGSKHACIIVDVAGGWGVEAAVAATDWRAAADAAAAAFASGAGPPDGGLAAAVEALEDNEGGEGEGGAAGGDAVVTVWEETGGGPRRGAPAGPAAVLTLAIDANSPHEAVTVGGGAVAGVRRRLEVGREARGEGRSALCRRHPHAPPHPTPARHQLPPAPARRPPVGRGQRRGRGRPFLLADRRRVGRRRRPAAVPVGDAGVAHHGRRGAAAQPGAGRRGEGGQGGGRGVVGLPRRRRRPGHPGAGVRGAMQCCFRPGPSLALSQASIAPLRRPRAAARASRRRRMRCCAALPSPPPSGGGVGGRGGAAAAREAATAATGSAAKAGSASAARSDAASAAPARERAVPRASLGPSEAPNRPCLSRAAASASPSAAASAPRSPSAGPPAARARLAVRLRALEPVRGARGGAEAAARSRKRSLRTTLRFRWPGTLPGAVGAGAASEPGCLAALAALPRRRAVFFTWGGEWGSARRRWRRPGGPARPGAGAMLQHIPSRGRLGGGAEWQPLECGAGSAGELTPAAQRPRGPMRVASAPRAPLTPSWHRRRVTARAEPTDEPTPAPVPPADLIEIGVFGGPHGVRGEVRLFPSTDDPAARLRAGERWVAPPPGGLGRTALPRPVRVAGSRAVVSRGKETWLVRLDGVADADGAAALTNQRLLIPASARPPLPPGSDEWYVQDLAGATVVLEEGGSVIGRVSDVYVETGGADLLRLELDRKTDSGVDGGPVDPSLPLPTVLLPFTREFAPSFDAATRTLTIAPPAGLLDLATSPGSGRKASRRPKTTRKARDGGAREAKREASGAGGERRGAGASDEGE